MYIGTINSVSIENFSMKLVQYVVMQWADFCKALYVEANWYNKGYTPTLKEYLNNAWISSGGTVLTVHSIFSILINTPTEEMMIIQNILNKFQDLVYNSSIIIRICNDLGTSTVNNTLTTTPSCFDFGVVLHNFSKSVTDCDSLHVINRQSWREEMWLHQYCVTCKK